MTALHTNVFFDLFVRNHRCVAVQRSASGKALWCVYKSAPAMDDDEYRWQHMQIERWLPKGIERHVAPYQVDPVRLRHLGMGDYHFNELALNIILPPYSPPKPIEKEIKYNNTNIDLQTLERIMKHIPRSDDYNEWFKIACGCKRTGTELGDVEGAWKIFDSWSSGSVKYNTKQNRRTWDKIDQFSTIGKRVITIGTLIRITKEHKYII